MKDYNGFSGDERTKSYNKLRYLVAKGEVEDWKHKPCEICGLQSPTNMAHQEDYADHRHYHTLCIECHLKLHSRFSKPLMWIKHLENVKNGYVSIEYKSVNHFFSAIKKQVNDYSNSENLMPTDFGNEWFHNLSMQKVNLNSENLIKYE